MTLLLISVLAASTTTWEMNSYADFVRGKFERVSLSRDGRLSAGPKLDAVFSGDDAVVWSVARDRSGALWAATGHKGRVYRIAGGKSELVWTAPEPEVFAIAAAADGSVFAATSPDGKIYRIAGGNAEEYFAPKAKYVWALAVGADGSLYAGTDGGRVWRVTAKGAGEIWLESEQGHVTALAIDAKGMLLAGTEPNGILYRVLSKGKAFALFDANYPEIRSITPMPDGSIYVAALGGAVGRKQGATPGQSPAVTAPQTGTPTISITVTGDAARAQQDAIDIKPADPAKPQVQQQQGTQAAQATQSVFEMAGVERSALYRIAADSTSEQLWVSKEESAYDLAVRGRDLWFATDQSGRVYKLTPDRKVTLVAETGESDTTRILLDGDAVLVATGNAGRIYRAGDERAASAAYESPVHDASAVARWGQIEWRGEGTVAVRTRSGNSLRPDATWSDWSEAMRAPAKVASPNARYIQWKAEITGAAAIDDVTVSYLPQNQTPVVRSMTVLALLSQQSTYKPAATAAADGSMSVTVTDTEDPSLTPSAGTPSQILAKPVSAQLSLTWQAEDPDGDRLVYSVWFRGEDEREWKLLRDGLHDSSFAIDGDALADGRYRFKIAASDREANAADDSRESDLVSSPVLIDNTPPAVRAARKASGEVEVTVVDASSAVRRCEYSVDAGGWRAARAADGVADSREETFTFTPAGLTPGEHLLTIRAVDAAGNAGVTKLILQQPAR